MGTEEHRRAAEARGPVGLAVVTVSDTRTPETDVNGTYLREAILGAGHRLASYRLIRDEPAALEQALEELTADRSVQGIILNGGTGISARDRTYDVLAPRLEKTIPGFGEIFRLLSYQQVGSAAILSRAVAGVYRGVLILSVPGSPAAVRLAWERLIRPEIGHLISELAKHR